MKKVLCGLAASIYSPPPPALLWLALFYPAPSRPTFSISMCCYCINKESLLLTRTRSTNTKGGTMQVQCKGRRRQPNSSEQSRIVGPISRLNSHRVALHISSTVPWNSYGNKLMRKGCNDDQSSPISVQFYTRGLSVSCLSTIPPLQY